MSIYNEETFGPVLGIVRAATFDEAVGLIGINMPISVPAGYLSFGGTRTSAFADLPMRGEDSIRFFTRQKEVTVRWPEPGRRPALSLVFPANQ